MNEVLKTAFEVLKQVVMDPGSFLRWQSSGLSLACVIVAAIVLFLLHRKEQQMPPGPVYGFLLLIGVLSGLATILQPRGAGPQVDSVKSVIINIEAAADAIANAEAGATTSLKAIRTSATNIGDGTKTYECKTLAAEIANVQVQGVEGDLNTALQKLTAGRTKLETIIDTH